MSDKGTALLPSFVIGNSYMRKGQINGPYGGSGQSGISPSNRVPAVFIFTGDSGEQYGYTDQRDSDGNLIYTGEGQIGDMTLNRGNAAITSHAKEGRALHVFRTTGKGKPCVYQGEFAYEDHYFTRGPDKLGNDREIIIFRLVPIQETVEAENSEDNEAEGFSVGADLRELRNQAINACSPQIGQAQKVGTRTLYERSRKVKKYVLARANGICELCLKPAPFNRKSDGSPYLEPHHINRLTDGGLDHPSYVGAVCPACHRLIHHGVGGMEKNEELRKNIECVEQKV